MVRVVNGIKVSKRPNRFKGEVEDLKGERFGELTVLEVVDKDSHGRAIWECLCSCGKKCRVRARSLKSGQVISCGHVNRQKSAERMGKLNYKHGASNEPWFSNYLGMLHRVYNPNERQRLYYNHEKIKGDLIDPEWETNPWAFYKEIGPKPDLHATVDRIDGHKGYIPGNVRWASHELQSINRTYDNDRNDFSVSYQGVRLVKKGVNRRAHDRYCAMITVNKEHIVLGYFLSLDNALRARYDAEAEYGFPHSFERPEGPITKEPDYTRGGHPGIAYNQERKKYRVVIRDLDGKRMYVGSTDTLVDAKDLQKQEAIKYLKDPKKYVQSRPRSEFYGVIGLDPQGNSHYYETVTDANKQLGTKSNLNRRLHDGKAFTRRSSKLYGWKFRYATKEEQEKFVKRC